MSQDSYIFMQQWVEVAYLTRDFVTRTHECAFPNGSCDSLFSENSGGR